MYIRKLDSVTIKIPRVSSFLDIGILIMSLKVFLSGSILIPYSSAVDNVLTAMAVFVLVVSILQDRYTVSVMIAYLAVTLISLYSVIRTGDYGFLITIIMCMALRKHDLNRELKLIFQFQLFLFILHILLSVLLDLAGVIPLSLSSRGESRCRFGFVHPNTFSIYLFNLLILWTWLRYDRLKNRDIILAALISLAFSLFTRTRTSLLTTLAFCLFLWMSRSSRKQIHRFLQFCTRWAVPFFSGFMLLCTYLYTRGSTVVSLINMAITGRIKLGAYAHSMYDYTFLGQPVDFHTGWNAQWNLNDFTFDNLYNYLLMNQGWVWLVLLAVLFYCLVKKCDIKICPFLLVWALYGMTEIHGLNGFLCFPVFLIVLLMQERPVVQTEPEKQKRIF